MTDPATASTASGDQAPASLGRRLSQLQTIWRFVTRYPGHLTVAVISLLAASGATLAIPQGFRFVVDNGFGADDPNAITPYFLGLLGIVVVLAAATALRFYCVTWLGERVIADLRAAVHRHLLTLSPQFFEENRPSEIASRLTADTTIIEQVVGTSVSVALRNLITCVGGIFLLFITSPKHAALLLLVIPAVVVPIIVLGRRVRTLSRSSQDAVAQVATLADEALGAIRIVQAFTQERREAERFGGIVEGAFTAARKRFTARAILTALVILLVFSAITFVLWDGARDVIAGNLSGGAITAFVLWAALVAGAIGSLTEVFGDVMRAAGAAGRLSELLRADPIISAPANPVALPVPAQGRVEFDNVSFTYPSAKDAPALYDLTLAVSPGETVAVVGPSGAGKSTLFQLIQRFYDPQAGEIRLDGIPLPKADPQELRARMAVVPQETVIFAATAYENILYGRPDATEAEVWAAAEAANAAEFLRAMPDGIHTYLGESGVRLSGGQRQRLAIARAILRDAPVLLLDEATSALDAESERLVQQALEKLMAGRTTLVIAHRLATVVRADRIVVLEKGRIVASGTHQQLLAEGGLYARLANLQFDTAAEAVS
ncbi:MAG TPA: ABC transporter transmembrane domain-containing protein [Pedomonas sp.]|uniref:ABC transporter transmembrane domain-containing protein n=1 Tax=Pedomonas sp. TaxID=2976421 RepID=UPI002F41EF77